MREHTTKDTPNNKDSNVIPFTSKEKQLKLIAVNKIRAVVKLPHCDLTFDCISREDSIIERCPHRAKCMEHKNLLNLVS